MNDIEEMFAELDGRVRLEEALNIWCHYKKHSEGAWKRAFKTERPEAYRKWEREAKRRYVDKHREHMREVWKRNAKAYRARKKARKEQARS